MEDSIQIKVTNDDCVTTIFEVAFDAEKGYISYDYFEPSVPDEIQITGIKLNDIDVSEELYDMLMKDNEDYFYVTIETYLNSGR